MSNSSLINKKQLTKVNYDKGRDGYKIKKITVHHCAGVMSIDSIGKFFANGSRQVSAHYGIGYDGKIIQCVDEKNTAWTDGNWISNCTSVTIETSNNKTGGKWTVSNSSLNSLIKLVADIAYRNNLGKLVVGKNLTYHSMYAATACPGPYLKGKMSYIATEANKINDKKKNTYTVGNYKCNYAMNIRKGAGVKYARKKISEITTDGRRNATSTKSTAYATYKKGTVFTASKILKASDGSIWGKSPSGYICIKGKNTVYCKKI